MGRDLPSALAALQAQFDSLDWTYHDVEIGGQTEKMYKWPGPPQDDILVCVHHSGAVRELFHRHDFFYFNYTYKGQYDSLSYKYDNLITIREGELYAGQPFAGHALCVHDNQETIIIGVVIKKETFFRAFLPLLSADSRLFHFLLDPATKTHSDEFIHFKVENACEIRALLEMMVVEYAHRQPDTQGILKPLALSFLTQVARQYAATGPQPAAGLLSHQIVTYIGQHLDTASLKDIGAHFSYHPNYISALLRRELGKSFSQLLLEQRMERAVLLLKETTLSVQETALLLGYSNSSNFYKAFRAFYGYPPRAYTSAK